MIVIGIVGAPAGGKSTVAAILAELGSTWLDADRIAREVLQTREIQARLIDHFGVEITGDGGEIDRSRLAARVFGDDDRSRAALTYLESVIHPRTRAHISARLREEFARDPVGSVTLLDIPLLFEAGWDCWCDEIVCVDSPTAVRQTRARERGWSEDELRRRENNQWPIADKKRLSTYVLTNAQDLASLRAEVKAWFSRFDLYLRQSRIDPVPSDPHC